MADASMLRTKILANVLSTPLETGESSAIPDFAANGSRVILTAGLRQTRMRARRYALPKVEKGDPLTLIEAHSEGKETQPPARYSEAGLVKELEKRGIGRPSTYASTIRTLDTRGYVEKQGAHAYTDRDWRCGFFLHRTKFRRLY